MTAPEQPYMPKRKRKHVVRKLKESTYVEEEQVEEATKLVSREVRRKKVNDEDEGEFDLVSDELDPNSTISTSV